MTLTNLQQRFLESPQLPSAVADALFDAVEDIEVVYHPSKYNLSEAHIAEMVASRRLPARKAAMLAASTTSPDRLLDMTDDRRVTVMTEIVGNSHTPVEALIRIFHREVEQGKFDRGLWLDAFRALPIHHMQLQAEQFRDNPTVFRQLARQIADAYRGHPATDEELRWVTTVAGSPVAVAAAAVIIDGILAGVGDIDAYETFMQLLAESPYGATALSEMFRTGELRLWTDTIVDLVEPLLPHLWAGVQLKGSFQSFQCITPGTKDGQAATALLQQRAVSHRIWEVCDAAAATRLRDLTPPPSRLLMYTGTLPPEAVPEAAQWWIDHLELVDTYTAVGRGREGCSGFLFRNGTHLSAEVGHKLWETFMTHTRSEGRTQKLTAASLDWTPFPAKPEVFAPLLASTFNEAVNWMIGDTVINAVPVTAESVAAVFGALFTDDNVKGIPRVSALTEERFFAHPLINVAIDAVPGGTQELWQVLTATLPARGYLINRLATELGSSPARWLVLTQAVLPDWTGTMPDLIDVVKAIVPDDA